MTVRKRFGQHFLEPAWIAKVIDAIAPAPDEAFLEIGPGPGALTRPLAERCRRIIAVEIDRDLARALPSRVPQNVEVVTADVLRVDLVPLLRSLADGGRARVAGNLPYNISTPTLFAGTRGGAPRASRRRRDIHAPARGRRATDGDPWIRRLRCAQRSRRPAWRESDRVLTLPPGAFRPPPQVTSSLVRLEFLSPADMPRCARLVRRHGPRRLRPAAEDDGQRAVSRSRPPEGVTHDRPSNRPASTRNDVRKPSHSTNSSSSPVGSLEVRSRYR